jgi:hypothetical protein
MDRSIIPTLINQDGSDIQITPTVSVNTLLDEALNRLSRLEHNLNGMSTNPTIRYMLPLFELLLVSAAQTAREAGVLVKLARDAKRVGGHEHE